MWAILYFIDYHISKVVYRTLALFKGKKVKELEERVSYLESYVGQLINDMVALKEQQEKPTYFSNKKGG